MSTMQVCTPVSAQSPGITDARRGLLLGALAVVIFALTFPMTRMAVGTAEAPQLSPAFVAVARAAGAGLIGAVYLLACRAGLPKRAQLPALALSAAGIVFGFPLFLALALREVPAMHAAIVTGITPLTTAAFAAIVLRQRASASFWACAVLGCGLVLAFAMWESGGTVTVADGWLLLAVFSAGGGYVAGARLSAEMPAERVISWVLVLSLPLTAPLAMVWWPTQPASAAAWGGLVYVTVFAMWLGFFFWYRGLALGGTLRVSQIQLLQPFLALIFSVPLLGEPLRASTVVFALLVLATVFVGRRAPVQGPALPSGR
jgi:drug/metabolite transporter (DMT)-like permease